MLCVASEGSRACSGMKDLPVALEGNEKGHEKVKGFPRDTGLLAQSLSL